MISTTHVLYLHGFRSSPLSAKAQLTAQWLAKQHPSVHLACPQLPVSPLEAAELIRDILSGWPSRSSVVIGSSLGGFYATWAAAEHGCAAVLLNPAVHPARDLSGYLGVHPCWHDPSQHIEVKHSHIEEMKCLYVGRGLDCLSETDRSMAPALADPERLLAVIAKGDELLNWHEMHARYAWAQTYVLQASDHGISDFSEHLHVVSDFLFDHRD
jgi:predicted esterase YcpF (UPF0227 family)